MTRASERTGRGYGSISGEYMVKTTMRATVAVVAVAAALVAAGCEIGNIEKVGSDTSAAATDEAPQDESQDTAAED